MSTTVEQSKIKQEIDQMMAKARAAQKIAEGYSQQRVLELARALGVICIRHAQEWADATMAETGLGDIPSKLLRMNNRPRGVMRDLLNAKTVGVMEVDEERHLVKIAKPVGVIAGIVPMTVPETVPVIKGMNAVMGRNAIIFSPHPRSKKITCKVVEALRDCLTKMGAPADLLQCIPEPSMALSQELMKQADLVIATGGAGLVKAAYSSGTPAYGVGVGNVVTVVDETADLKDAASKIIESKINDLATGCSTENNLLIQNSVYDAMMAQLQAAGAYLANDQEKAAIQSRLWTEKGLNPEIICRPATVIAEKCGFTVPDTTKIILVKETGIGADYPFSGEKLSVVLTVYAYDTIDQAIDMVNEIQAYKGAGHSCGIHSTNEDHIQKFAMQTKTSRVMVCQAQNKANAGNFNNGMPFTISLGCGTWGGNITNENITWKHYINVTWVAREFAGVEPSDEELFGDVWNKL